MLTVAVGMVLSVSVVGTRAQATGGDEWGKLVAANNLDVKGNTPFHLEITFQLYDLDGKATTKGTVEDWWAAPGSERVIVHMAGLNEDGSLSAEASHELTCDLEIHYKSGALQVKRASTEVEANAAALAAARAHAGERIFCDANSFRRSRILWRYRRPGL